MIFTSLIYLSWLRHLAQVLFPPIFKTLGSLSACFDNFSCSFYGIGFAFSSLRPLILRGIYIYNLLHDLLTALVIFVCNIISFLDGNLSEFVIWLWLLGQIVLWHWKTGFWFIHRWLRLELGFQRFVSANYNRYLLTSFLVRLFFLRVQPSLELVQSFHNSRCISAPSNLCFNSCEYRLWFSNMEFSIECMK